MEIHHGLFECDAAATSGAAAPVLTVTVHARMILYTDRGKEWVLLEGTGAITIGRQPDQDIVLGRKVRAGSACAPAWHVTDCDD